MRLVALLLLSVLPTCAPDTTLIDPEEQKQTFILPFETAPKLLPDHTTALAEMQRQVRWPDSLRAAGVEGRVIVQFTVSKQGTVVDPFVVRSVHSELDAESCASSERSASHPSNSKASQSKYR